MSPILETAADRARQVRVGDLIAPLMDWSVEHTPPLYPVDYFFRCDGQVTAVGELKCRDNRWGEWPTEDDVFLAKTKYEDILNERLKAPLTYGLVRPNAYFIVRFTDPLLVWVDLAVVDTSKPEVMDRKKARASGLVGVNDRELGYKVPLDRFEVLLPRAGSAQIARR